MSQKFLGAILLAAALPLFGQTSPTLAPPTDGQIMKIVATIDEGEIAASKMAHSTSKNKEVQKFATMMIKQHTQNDKMVAALGKKEKITPEESEVSTNVKKEADAVWDELHSKSGADFDQAYMQKQVDMHDQALRSLKESLIPSAQNASLKKFLEKTSGDVSTHLELAKSLQAKLH